MKIRKIYQLRASWYRDMARRASEYHATIMALSGDHGEIDEGIADGYLKQARLYERLARNTVLGFFAYPVLEIADRGLENHA